jgi:hypothetical protein
MNRRVRSIGGQRPVHGAYAYADMTSTCPHCDSPPGDYCTRPDGHYRRTPCLARMKPAVSRGHTAERPTLTVAK